MTNRKLIVIAAVTVAAGVVQGTCLLWLRSRARAAHAEVGVNREESSQLPLRALRDRGGDYWRTDCGKNLWSCWFQGKKPPPGKMLRSWTRDEVAAAWGPITEVTDPEEVLPWD
jgi:hypothetical protein